MFDLKWIPPDFLYAESELPFFSPLVTSSAEEESSIACRLTWYQGASVQVNQLGAVAVTSPILRKDLARSCRNIRQVCREAQNLSC